MNISLNFGEFRPPTAASTVRLDFGASHAQSSPAATAAICLRLAPPRVRIQAHYDNRVSRKCEGGGALVWRAAARLTEGVSTHWEHTQREREVVSSAWLRGAPAAVAVAVPGGCHAVRHEGCHVEWSRTLCCGHGAAARFALLVPTREAPCLAWETAIPARRGAAEGFVSLAPLAHHEALAWRPVTPHVISLSAGFSPGKACFRRWGAPWQRGTWPAQGVSHLPADPAAPLAPTVCHPHLDFRSSANLAGLLWCPHLHLDFGAGSAGRPVQIPVLRVYFVSNTVDVVRLPGREPIPVKGVQISIDADSWAWGLTASLPYSALDMVEPGATGPVEIEITINGVSWVMLVEGFELRREFGQSSLSIQGRSRAAYLADPYAPARSFVPTQPFSAQQLAQQELNRAGLVTGFDLDWQLPDWLVPEGAWSYQGLTPIAAIGRIVSAVGGTFYAHPHRKTLLARSRYPTLPWEWETQTPDVSLPLDFVKTLGLRWQEKPAYNAVYVAGERLGLTGLVRRAGSAGDVLAPMVVDALITHADAARERGRAILADTGRQASVTLELPMPPSMGLIAPGQLLAVSDNAAAQNTWRGLVRATRISAEWGTSLSVRQSLELERHFF